VREKGVRSGNGEAASACGIADSCVLTFLSAGRRPSGGGRQLGRTGPGPYEPTCKSTFRSLCSPSPSLPDLLLWIGSPEERERESLEREREDEGGVVVGGRGGCWG
jgi:hypothetical protein